MVVNRVPSQKMRRFYRNAHGELVLSLARPFRLCLACAFTEKANREERKCHAVGEEVETIVERFVSLRTRRFPSAATCIITE